MKNMLRIGLVAIVATALAGCYAKTADEALLDNDIGEKMWALVDTKRIEQIRPVAEFLYYSIKANGDIAKDVARAAAWAARDIAMVAAKFAGRLVKSAFSAEALSAEREVYIKANQILWGILSESGIGAQLIAVTSGPDAGLLFKDINEAIAAGKPLPTLPPKK